MMTTILLIVAGIGVLAMAWTVYVSITHKTDPVQTKVRTFFGGGGGDETAKFCSKCGQEAPCDSPYCGMTAENQK